MRYYDTYVETSGKLREESNLRVGSRVTSLLIVEVKYFRLCVLYAEIPVTDPHHGSGGLRVGFTNMSVYFPRDYRSPQKDLSFLRNVDDTLEPVQWNGETRGPRSRYFISVQYF